MEANTEMTAMMELIDKDLKAATRKGTLLHCWWECKLI